MTFKEFSAWCNQRACDGCWGMMTAIACSNIILDVNDQPFWRREKYWKSKYEKDVMEEIVNPTNAKIKEVIGREINT